MMFGTSVFGDIAQSPTIPDSKADKLQMIEENSLIGTRTLHSIYYARASRYSDYKVLLNELSVKNPLLGCLTYQESHREHWNQGGTIKRGKAGEFGVAQFMWNTFYGFAKQMGFYDADILNPTHQLLVMEWALDNGLQKHWTTLKSCR